mmetsp:Transcript_12224/g.14386  ORF Transcript_12224/g.14386 Transcript_12224/m.14386 type:complete len:290 (+) Transcript_12224:261-1130(+)
MLISDDLHFKMTGIFTKLHEEDGAANDLVLNLNVGVLQVFWFVYKTNSLSTTTLGRFNHNTIIISNTIRGFDRLFNGTASSHFKGIIRNSPLHRQLRLQRSIIRATITPTPRNRRHLRRLRQNIRRNLIPQHTHNRSSRSNKPNPHLIQRIRQLRILTRMPPPRPNRIHTLLLRNRRNHIHIRIIIQILPPGNFHIRIRQPDEFRIGLQVFRCGHGDKGNGVFVSEFHVGPLAEGHDAFCGGHSVVGDEDFFYGAVSAAGFDVFVDGGCGLVDVGGGHWVGGGGGVGWV